MGQSREALRASFPGRSAAVPQEVAMGRKILRRFARHAAAAVAALPWVGAAEAAPPAGKPVFIQVQGLAPTTVGLNGFIVAGDFTEGGGFQWMPSSGVTLVGGTSA